MVLGVVALDFAAEGELKSSKPSSSVVAHEVKRDYIGFFEGGCSDDIQ